MAAPSPAAGSEYPRNYPLPIWKPSRLEKSLHAGPVFLKPVFLQPSACSYGQFPEASLAVTPHWPTPAAGRSAPVPARPWLPSVAPFAGMTRKKASAEFSVMSVEPEAPMEHSHRAAKLKSHRGHLCISISIGISIIKHNWHFLSLPQRTAGRGRSRAENHPFPWHFCPPFRKHKTNEIASPGRIPGSQ